MSTTDNMKKGNAFESMIANLYRALGYETKINENIDGHQVDVIAEKIIPGGARVCIIIECKYKERGNVTNDEASRFLNFFKSTSPSWGFTNGVIITNNSFSKEAKEIVRHYKSISLKTAAELEMEIINFSDSHIDIVRRYEASGVSSTYIPVRGSGGMPGSPDEIFHREILEDVVQEWVNSDTPGFLSILADFGAGKTTFLEKLHYDNILSGLHGKNSVIPFIFYLKEFLSFPDIDTYIVKSIQKIYRKEVSIEKFWEIIKSRKSLILLDGFDEIAAQSGRDRRGKLLHMLSPLLSFGGKSIMTCRPSFFVSSDEYDEIISSIIKNDFDVKPFYRNSGGRTFASRKEIHESHRAILEETFLGRRPAHVHDGYWSTVYIELFDDKDISSYLFQCDKQFRRKYKKSSEEIKEAMASVYDISDLIKRPILLKMMRDVLVNGRADLDELEQYVGPASLYENYTSMHLDIDWMKGDTKRLLTKDERREFAQAMAVGLLNSRSNDISYEEIEATIEANRDILSNIQKRFAGIDKKDIAADVQVCAFLTRTGDGLFRFSHKSFGEFFAARHLKSILDDGVLPDEFSKPVPWEVLYFIGAFALFEGRLKVRIQHLYRQNIRKTSTVQSRNLLSAILYSSKEHPEVLIKGVELSDLRFKELIFNGANLTNVRFMNVHMGAVSLSEESKFHAVINNSAIDKFDFTESDIKLSGDTSDIDEINSYYSSVDISGSFKINNFSCDACNVTVKIKGEIQKLTASGVGNRVILSDYGKNTYNKFTLISGKVRKGILNGVEFSTLKDNIDCTGLRFNGCIICGVKINILSAIQVVRAGAFSACSGVLFVTGASTSDTLFMKKGKDDIVRRSGYINVDDLIIVDFDNIKGDERDYVRRHCWFLGGDVFAS